MSVSVLITTTALNTLTSQDAVDFVRYVLSNKGGVEQVFFYQDGVDHANALRRPLGDEFNATRAWHALAEDFSVPLLVCVTAAERRGIVEDKSSAFPFKQVGLGEFFSRLHQSDKLVQF
ncbi:sulfurtransferase complex subunit TusD [Alteromonas oceanisediminis]|uniref:sulfurtransferase complex subunit TusD n=1 Tax=Alteromonas oceanisediminis TaxID=2836180 RepID=UPI001BDA1C60|nr:sulfurtransferase complex subunit TusD [Alteromonas oceanisediminis]MBT0586338.1 sulfurtransferase complex subunit TusD [Alteromonas oceanisediminis]